MSDQTLIALIQRYGAYCAAGGADHQKTAELLRQIQAEIRRRRYRLSKLGVISI